MAVKQITVSVPEDLADRIEQLAQKDAVPVSEWMTEAAARRARDAAARELLALLEAEDGPITDAELAEFQSRWQD